MDGIPSTYRIDPATGLSLPPAVITCAMNASYMPNPATLNPFNDNFMAVEEASSQGFLVSPVTISPWGIAYKSWFKPSYSGRFLVQGATDGYQTSIPSQLLIAMKVAAYDTVGGPKVSETQYNWRGYAYLAGDASEVKTLVGPLTNAASPGLINLSSDNWYRIIQRGIIAGSSFNYVCAAQFSMIEII